ncbi:MAG: hypothetical protein JF570_09920, partial [Caulobacter sp.]|nr:hypothetical protein [Caulobacter sp.]
MPTLRHAAAASLLGLVLAGPVLAAGQAARPLHDRVLVLDSHVDVPLDLGIG